MDLGTAINQIQSIKQEKKNAGRVQKAQTSNKAACLEVIQRHMENNNIKCLPLGHGQFAVLKEHLVKPTLKPEVVGYLFQAFFKHKGTDIPVESKQEFMTFVQKALATMTEMELRCEITDKKPVEAYLLG